MSGETFYFLEKCLLSILKFCALNNLLFFYDLLIGPYIQLSWNVLFSRNLIGQLGLLCDLGDSSHTVLLILLNAF